VAKVFKFVITSRPYEDILANWSRFHIIHLRAELEDPLVNKDVALFVGSEVERLARLRNYSQDLKERVQKALTDGADGMFLWAALMVKVLETTPIARASERLKSLPNGINALYDRVPAEIPEDSFDTISTILKWVVFSFRPLTVEELGVACAIDGASFKSLESIPLEIRTEIRGDLALCGTLLKIKGDLVHLVHQTTKEYLIRRSATDSAIQRLLPSPLQAHAQISLACLAFLNFKPSDSERLDIVVYEPGPGYFDRGTEVDLYFELSLFNYVSLYWASHLRESGPISEGTDLWETLAAVLETPTKVTVPSTKTRESTWFLDSRRSPLELLLSCGCNLTAESYARTGRFKAPDAP
jgi:hypothetical protein